MSKSAEKTIFEFTKENLAQAELQLAKYPKERKRSAILALLDLAQRQQGGHLTFATMEYVADMLGLPYIKVHEIATFYTMFNLSPIGRHHVQVCTTTPCWLRGSDDIMKSCKNKLKIESGQVTKDGNFSLIEVECLGACVNAPMAQINDDYYEDLNAASMEKILDNLAKGKECKPGPQVERVTSAPLSGAKTCLQK